MSSLAYRTYITTTSSGIIATSEAAMMPHGVRFTVFLTFKWPLSTSGVRSNFPQTRPSILQVKPTLLQLRSRSWKEKDPICLLQTCTISGVL